VTEPAPLRDGMLGCHVAPLADGGYLAPLARAVYFCNGLARTDDTAFALLAMRELVTFDLEAALDHRPSYMNGLRP
jgi:hypothetical protein